MTCAPRPDPNRPATALALVPSVTLHLSLLIVEPHLLIIFHHPGPFQENCSVFTGFPSLWVRVIYFWELVERSWSGGNTAWFHGVHLCESL